MSHLSFFWLKHSRDHQVKALESEFCNLVKQSADFLAKTTASSITSFLPWPWRASHPDKAGSTLAMRYWS